MAEFHKDLWKKVIGRYSWKLMELLTVIVLARLFLPVEFGFAFYVIAFVSMIYPFFVVKEKKEKEIYSNLLSLSLIKGAAGAIILFIASGFFHDAYIPFLLRFSGLAFLLSMAAVSPISYYTGEKKNDIIYRANLISQAAMLVIAVGLFFLNLGYQAILYSYLGFWLVRIMLLWRDMPKLNAFSFNFNIIKEFSIKKNLVKAALKSGLILIAPFYFGIESFSYLYIAFYLGFFLYENITLFLSSLLLPLFRKDIENPELFSFNLVRLLEYISFVIMPFTLIPLLLFKPVLGFFLGTNWEFYDIFFIIVIAGTAKSIFEVPGIVLMAKDKSKAIFRIRMVDLAILFITALVFGKSLGIFGLALAVLISSIISSLLFMLASLRLLNMNIIGVSKDYFYIIFSAILTSLLLGLMKEWFSADSFVPVFFLWLFGIVLFIISVYLINSDFLKRFTRFIFSIQNDEK